MFYEKELKFLWDVFEKCRLRMHLLSPEARETEEVDLGLRRCLGLERANQRFRDLLFRAGDPRTVYRLTDQYLCSYLILELPERETRTMLVAGPYLSVEVTREQIARQAEQLGLPPGAERVMEEHYSKVPQLAEQTIFAPLETFCERLWGADGYAMVDMNRELYPEELPAEGASFREDPGELLRRMEEMEKRYAFENELMRAVSMGQAHKVELVMASFSSFAFEKRLADPVRNLKNYAIIMNTLLRKAAEQGGVHPLYLDSISSEYAGKIEQIPSAAAGYGLMGEMYRGYCRLVRRHATRDYSPPVRRAIACIVGDLNGDLSLKALAAIQKINPSYLSTLFKKETGRTITDYVNYKRINFAVQLLTSTKLQIQIVAQHCGIPDVNYFTKVFKRYAGKTPRQFRQDSLYLAREGQTG